MTLHNTTVLVTGAGGFLGGALARRLAADGARVKALARRPEKATYVQNIEQIEIVAGDITDAERMKTVCAGCDYVFHVAVSFGSWDEQRAVNIKGTRHVAEAAALAGVRRLVHVSSVATYGYGIEGLIHEDRLLTPTAGEPYGTTKAAGEAALRAAAQAQNLSISIIRPGMIFGPRSGQWTHTMIKLAKVWPFIWPGDGSGSAFPIYVDDVVDLMMVQATHPAADGEAFNCVIDADVTWREFLGAYKSLTQNTSWIAIPPGLVAGVLGVVAALAPKESLLKVGPDAIRSLYRQARFDMTKARTLLNWSPQVRLEEGVQRSIPWLREKGLLK